MEATAMLEENAKLRLLCTKALEHIREYGHKCDEHYIIVAELKKAVGLT